MAFWEVWTEGLKQADWIEMIDKYWEPEVPEGQRESNGGTSIQEAVQISPS